MGIGSSRHWATRPARSVLICPSITPGHWCGRPSGRCSIRPPIPWSMHSAKGPSNSMDKPNIVVEVVYALADKQKLLRLSLPYGTTVRQAAVQSGMQAHFPDLDLHSKI